MTGQDRLLAALDGGAPVPPPTAPLYLSLYLEPRRRKLLAQVYAQMAEGESSLRLTFDDEIEARLEALGRATALFNDPPAWIPVGLGPSRAGVHGAKVTFPPGQCVWYPPGGGAPTDYLAFFDNRAPDLWEAAADLPDVAEIISERSEQRAQDLIEAGCAEYTARAVQRFGRHFVPTASLGSPFWHCYARLGFSGMMRALRERPELIGPITANDLHSSLENARAVWHAGVRCIFVEECLSSSDLISVDDYTRFAYPPTRDLIAGLKDIGFHVVYYFCGGIEGRVEHLAQLPADALAFEESKKGFVIDLGEIRDQMGPEPLLFGNTDVVLIRDGTQEQIAADVARQYAQAGPRFVASIGSPATLDTPPEKLDMLMRAAESL